MSTKRHAPIQISTILYEANVFRLRNWDKKLMNRDNLPHTVARLFTLLQDRRINHLLVGGIPLLQYVEGRNTKDIDLIIAEHDLTQVPEINISDQNSDFPHGTLDDFPIDLLLTNNPL